MTSRERETSCLSILPQSEDPVPQMKQGGGSLCRRWLEASCLPLGWWFHSCEHSRETWKENSLTQALHFPIFVYTGFNLKKLLGSAKVALVIFNMWNIYSLAINCNLLISKFTKKSSWIFSNEFVLWHSWINKKDELLIWHFVLILI